MLLPTELNENTLNASAARASRELHASRSSPRTSLHRFPSNDKKHSNLISFSLDLTLVCVAFEAQRVANKISRALNPSKKVISEKERRNVKKKRGHSYKLRLEIRLYVDRPHLEAKI
jgi:hypothetical protein